MKSHLTSEERRAQAITMLGKIAKKKALYAKAWRAYKKRNKQIEQMHIENFAALRVAWAEADRELVEDQT